MALFQISEPTTSSASASRRYAVGIDLGTTNSLVAVVRNGRAETLADEQARHLLPSVVRYFADGAAMVGDDALEVAHDDPLNTIASVKRLMGRGIDDVRRLGKTLPYDFVMGESAMPKLRTAAGARSAVEVSAEILKQLKRRAECALETSIADAVITVPAYFDEAQRQATKDAARLAGLNVLRLLNEPTAAAVAYGLDKNPQGIYAVYDLGGGTFDVSILHLQRGVFEVMATAGDSALGGDDMDHAIAAWMLEQAGIANSGHRQLRRVLRDARAAKQALTDEKCVMLAVKRERGEPWRDEFSREQLHALVDPLIEKTFASCRRALRDAGLDVHALQGVVLVGGATRMPRVRERVRAFFGRDALSDIDPDKVVALGAALQADALVGNRRDDELLLLDVIPLSLGVEIMGGMVEKIVLRNSPIPVARAQEFTTYKDGQTALALHIVQGERELVSDCRSLARFELRGIPPMVAGAARISVSFQIDADGLLSVSARERTAGVESGVTVQSSYGLTDAEIEAMLRDSVACAREDADSRRLRETRVEAQRLLEAVAAALATDASTLLDQHEREVIETALGRLRACSNDDNVRAIRDATKALDEASQEFAKRRMDAGIKRALVGHRMDQLKLSDKG